MTASDALALIKRRRTEACPIPAFIQLLESFEKQCLHSPENASATKRRVLGPEPPPKRHQVIGPQPRPSQSPLPLAQNVQSVETKDVTELDASLNDKGATDSRIG